MDPAHPRPPQTPNLGGGGASSAEETDPGLAPTRDLPSPAPPPEDSRYYHHYEVCLREDGTALHELGRGAMGISYKARDVNLDIPVAIKVIGAGLPGEFQARERFRREARATAQLRHPNVASVFHFGETPDGRCFYAMEFIEGETLAARVRREGPLPVAAVLEIALQVSAALMAADERGLVHRDLKPANIMLVANQRGRAQVKVIDFGLAKAAADAAAESQSDAPLTHTGGVLGTPAYASPEQAVGRQVDARSDIYSLGVTLWYLLTGRLPFTGRSFEEIRDGQLHRPLPVAQLADRTVPEPVVDLLRRMLAPKPSGRPASPAALHEELEILQEETGTRVARPPHLELEKMRLSVPARRRRRLIAFAPLLALTVLILGGLGTTYLWWTHRPVRTFEQATDKSVAVLPLEDLSGDAANAYLADGIQDDLLSSLSKVKDLKVVGRSSTIAYRDRAARNLREIGEQLGVANILEGSVRRSGDRVLVNVALTDARTGRQIWAERYDRTFADALTLQGEISTEIASALSATLSPEEKARMEAKPTDNADAYILYLRARDYHTRPTGLAQDYATAVRLYRQALELDPNFALAHARLAAALAYTYVNFIPSPEIRTEARAEAELSLRLRPNLGEGVVARALCLYWTDKDYPAALRELAQAARLLPNNAEIELFTAAIHRRQGHWAEATAEMKRALSRDPRNAQIAREIMVIHLMVRDWESAGRDGARAAALAPDNLILQTELPWVDLWSRDDVRPLRAALAAVPTGFDPDGIITYSRWDAALYARDFAAAERFVDASAVENVWSTFGTLLPKSYLRGCIALAGGNEAVARPLFEAACPGIEAQAANFPQDPFRQSRLGVLYAFLGRKEEAIRLGQRAVELMPESRDAFYGANIAGTLALIYARTGENDRALALIERLLRVPGPLSPHYDGSMTASSLRLRWSWDPLRSDPRFQALVSGPEPKTVYQ